jgi:hypothetical protein
MHAFSLVHALQLVKFGGEALLSVSFEVLDDNCYVHMS